jgi:F-type H+-transporting ATPase subunit b
MQSLDVISVNIWHILISLINLLLLFFVVKKLLFKPVKKLFAERQAALDHQYAAANEAERAALENKAEWEKKLEGADTRADEIIKNATDTADYRSQQIIAEANAKARDIMNRAETEAELTRKKAEDGIKREIVEVSAAIAQKMLEREVDTADHRAMIDSFINEIGDGDDADK